ncbi:MAG: DUF748 domain-containing protein [Spirosomaceae bacterium]|nr:DUF748 domain-containing protein [Spirosomataceae bacterium]
MKKGTKILIGIAIVLIIFRLLLPTIVLRYVNNALQNIDGYTGHVEDIDIALIRGAYQIEGMVIEKVDNEVKEPFMALPLTDLSIQWSALFKGKVVGEITCDSPIINFSYGPSEEMQQTGAETDWTLVIKDLMPIEINRFTVNDGKVNLINIMSEPQVNVSLNQIQLSMTNLRNAEESEERLPSDVNLTANFVGANAPVVFNAKMLILKEIPDFEFDLSVDNYPLQDINELTKFYTGMDFEKGTLSMYSEMGLKDSQLEGYLKPLTKDLKIFKFNENDTEGDKRSVGEFLKELGAEVGSKILTNRKKDQVAAKIPIKGNVENVETTFWPILFSTIKNAYIEAFKKEFENQYYFSKIGTEKSDEPKK